ncbi:MAG TPA: protein kinase [Blastocatellia bacterium]|nr:protein kinase [Blastocatellia bacterium]
MPIGPSTSLGPYEILSQLGAGGMGEVWRARDTRLSREVAIKVLPASFAADEDRLRRFEQEARATSALNHPNIVTIHELGEDGDARFIVMELVEGRTLRALIDEGLSLNGFAQLASQMAKALGAAHAAGITHRDIKPENIMVRGDGYVKVLDFGLARLVPTGMDKEAATLQYTQPGILLGSARYMSPEQARGESVSNPSDIFSLGMIFYEMVTGRHPFATDSLLGTLNAITGQVPAPPSRLNPELPSAIETLILQMIEKDARLRPTAAEVETALAEAGGPGLSVQSSAAVLRPRTRHTVGREKAHAELREAFASASAGNGLLMCVPGEPGMGKTTLVEDFLSDLRAGSQACVIARGRCSERLAGTEAYLPWLEVLASLLRGADGQSRTSLSGSESIVQTTKRLAPTWYAQAMPLQPDDSSVERLLAERAASQERMKREFGALLEEISERRPLVLFFDDLHWADVSTIDLLSYLASKFDSMRVLIIATYRPSDLLLAKHPFLQVRPDLQARGVCREIELGFLSRAEIEMYLALEFPEHRFPPELPALIHAKTEGNPLFMADLVRYLRGRDVIAEEQGRWVLAQSLPSIERDLPESVRGMIERKVAQVSEEDRRLLVAASVQGYEFDSAIVARALELDPADVEERLEALERVYSLVRFVSEIEFPGRVLTLRYRFVHVLYQNALYASLRPTRRAQLSRTVAEALLECYGKQSAAVASELAFLFEAARDWSRAADYYLVAANNASDVFALQEAGTLAQRGLDMLRLLPEQTECAKQELSLQTMLGQSLMVAKGYALPEVEQAFIRARELSLQLNEIAQLFRAQFSLAIVYVVRAEYERAFEHGEQCLRLAENTRNQTMLLQSHWVIGLSQCYLGKFAAARDHFERTLAVHDAAGIDTAASMYGAVLSRAHLARMLLFLGYPEQSQKAMKEAIARAGRIRVPVAVANTLALAAYLEAFHHNVEKTLELTAATASQAEEHGLPYYAAAATLTRGWALAMQNQEEEGIALIRQGLASSLAIGTRQQHGYFLALLAEALNQAGRVEEELEALREGMDVAQQTNEPFYDAELYRLRGDALAKAGVVSPSEAETCYQRAIEIAREQQAKSFELRAAMSLARLRQQQGKCEEGRAILADVYGWFTEGFDTADLRNARALLDELGMEFSLQTGGSVTDRRLTK